MEDRLKSSELNITRKEKSILMQSINFTKRRIIEIRHHMNAVIDNELYLRCKGIDFCREGADNSSSWFSKDFLVETSEVRGGTYTMLFNLFLELDRCEERRKKSEIAIQLCNILNFGAQEGHEVQFIQLQRDFQYIYRTEMYNMIIFFTL